MTGCCGSGGLDDEFTPATAERQLRRWRAVGPLGRERTVLAALDERGLDGVRVLEVGGGIGQLQVALLERGATSAANVEAVASYEDAAVRLLASSGIHAGRVERIVADAADPSLDVPAADVALAHRMLCCTPDWRAVCDTLLRSGATTVALTLPRDGRLAGAVVAAANLLMRALRRGFRMHHHVVDDVLAHLGHAGLAVVHDDTGPFWRTVVLVAA